MDLIERERQRVFPLYIVQFERRCQFWLKVNIRWKFHLHTGNLLCPASNVLLKIEEARTDEADGRMYSVVTS